MSKKTFYFDTGVGPNPQARPPIQLYGRQVWKDGTKQIPFICEDVPENASLMFACDNPDLPEHKQNNVIVRQILDSGPGGMLSKYAYFKIGTNEHK